MLPRLTRTFRVVTYDARGHGLSAKPSSGYGFDPVVADASAVIRARPAPAPDRRGAFMGRDGRPRARRSSSAIWSRAPCSSTAASARSAETMDWATAKEQLAPPHLAGMPVERVPRDDPDVPRRRRSRSRRRSRRSSCPVMHVDRHGRIRPRLSRANHFRILRAIWLHDPDAALAAPARPDPRRPRSRRRRPGSGTSANAPLAEHAGRSGAPVRISWMEGIHDLPLQHPDALAAASNVSPTASYDEDMGWVILLLVLLAAAFGVLGAVVKVAAFLVLTILLTITALVAVAGTRSRASSGDGSETASAGSFAGPHVVVGSPTAATAGPALPRRPLLGPVRELTARATGVARADARAPGTTR